MKLSPCPKCGSENIVTDQFPKYPFGFGYVCFCDECNFCETTMVKDEDIDEMVEYCKTYPTERGSKIMWNRFVKRHEETPK